LNCVGFVSGDNNTIYVGAASGGIWKASNGGSSWTPLGDNNAVLGVSDIAVVPGSNPHTIYIATGDKNGGSMWSLGGGQNNDNNSVGILKSTDGGTTWNTTGLSYTPSQQRTVNRLLLHPTDYNILYAATSVGVYKTTNGGTSWSQISTNVFADMEFKPGTPATIYGSNYNGDIYRSTNDGSTWTATLSTSNSRTEIAVSANNSAVVYAILSNSSSGLAGIYKSTDSGASFSQVFSGATTNLLNWDCSSTTSGGQAWYDLCIAADPTNANNVFVGGVNTWRSTNGGTSWSISNHWTGSCSVTAVHADKHYLAYQNGTSTLFECNDGGFYKTTNNGSSWTHLGSGLVTSQIYRLGVAQTVTNENIIGLQDNGTKSFISGGWYDEIGGDGFECAFDYTNQNTMYGELYYGDIRRSTTHGASWSAITSGLTGSAHWCTPFVLDPNVNTTLYIGYQDVWKSTNQGTTWTKISTWAGSTLRSLAVAKSNSSYIYAATQTVLYRTTNGGTSWSNITGTIPVGSGNITYVSVKNDDANTVWVSLGGYNSTKVYQTTNGGTTWTNISTGLPSVPVMCVIQNKQNTSQIELYAGTDAGVYVKNGSANWTMFSTGLPNVVVTELEIYYNATPANSRIRAATFGRGLWQSDLLSTVAAPVANFTASTTTPYIGQTVTFTDLSTNTPTTWAWSFSPSTVTYVGGTNSSSQNPQVQFNAGGLYTVTLTASNAGGSDGETKNNYISVFYAPVANFSANNTSPAIGQTVAFTDLSTNTPTSWSWSFSPATVTYVGGTTSTSQNPQVQFTAGGSCSVTLIATNASGSDPETKNNYISVLSPPIADFDADYYTPVVGQTVYFWDMSINNPTSWSWSFNPSTITFVGGTNANSQDPEVQFNAGGSYSVTLTVTNASGGDSETKTNFINVPFPPVTDFSASNTTPGIGQTVNFTDLTTNNPYMWLWSFSPATISYTGGTNALSQNPQVKFNAGGLYSVTLTATNIGGSDVEVKSNYISVPYPPVADFQASTTTPIIGQTVTFTDLSTNTPTSWAWSFSPGTVTYTGGTGATSQNPQVQFTAGGLYTVTLTATNASGSDGETKINYISVTAPPVANFSAGNTNPVVGETVTFSDLSSNSPTSWLWSFVPGTVTYMGGTSAISQNPMVQFNNGGLYTVTLIATNAAGSDDEIKVDYITVTAPPIADFSADIILTSTGQTVSFTDQSTNSPIFWSWSFTPSAVSFVNGTDALSQNPQVHFDMQGSYTVELIVSNAAGSSIETKTDYITVLNLPVADFTADNTNPAVGGSVNFTDLSLNNPTTWSWVFNPTTVTYLGGTSSNSQNPQVQFDVAGYYTVELTVTNTIGSNTESKTDYIHVQNPIIVLDITVYLEGPFNGATMTPNLSSILPLTQPYNISPWNYTGTESVGSIPNGNIVDWVLVELRDAASAATATSATMMDRQAAFLLSNGKVVGMDGSSTLQFNNSLIQQLFVVLWHRNHLGVMTSSFVTESGGSYTYNFSTGATQAYGSTAAHKQIGPGIWGMMGGDGNRDGGVTLTDESPLWEAQSGTQGYLESDYNLDLQSDNKDKDDIWAPNLGVGSSVPN
jgi:PKD repeat protein